MVFPALIPVAASSVVFESVAWSLFRIVAALLAVLLAQILGLRLLLARRRRRAQQFRAVWEPLLASCVDDFPARLPRLRRRDVPEFLLIWNFLQETLRDQARDRLNRVAIRVRADRQVARLVRHGGVRNRLVALTAAGHLGDLALSADLERIVQESDTTVSLCAAKALARIDGVRAAPLIVNLIAQREDWPAAGVATVLAEAGPAAVSGPLTAAAAAADPALAPRLIRLLELAHADAAAPVIRRFLQQSDAVEVVSTALRVVKDPSLLDDVRALLYSPHWQVRLQAALTLGRMGTRDDEVHLVVALADSQWWVRYRVAQSLARLPFMDTRRLRRLSETVEDPYGRDILRQVIAERELAC